MLEQMQQEKELSRKIYEFENATRKQEEELKHQLGGTAEDQSMSKRRADSDGEGENYNKKSRAQYENGRSAYDSPSNRAIKGAGYSWNMYGDETGTIGNKEPKKGHGNEKGKGKGKNKGKGKGKQEHHNKGAELFFPAPDH